MESNAIILCTHCGTQVEKPAKEVRRQKKAGQTVFFCSQAHSAAYWNSRRDYLLSQSARDHLQSISGSRRDDHTQFRWFLLRVRARQKDTDLTVEYLKTLWDQQIGLCPITGWEISLPVSTRGFRDFSPRNASLDKIVPSSGYAQGNVRFVALIVNYAKNVWADEAVLDFCHAVASHHPVSVDFR